ncbi:ABC transporter permease [Lentzea sp. NPDC058436]|uniref:ABC transporter permease n=1 Tax=Lentzea sp. NPDC058436 TaxID=3346499 RepID=UPI0036545A56
MNNGIIAPGPVLAAVLLALVVVAAVVMWLGRIGQWHAAVTASARAIAQLGVVSLLIAAVLQSMWLTALFIVVMFGVAAATSARRVGELRDCAWTSAALGAGVVPVLAMLVGSRLIPVAPIALVPIAGILIGGAMTATSLTGRRALEVLKTRHGEYEAARALGFGQRDAVLLICRPSAGDALLPALDQTRTVGLVTLPGAFVGVLLGGATPLQAGATQVLVLIALLAVEAVAALVVVELVAAGRLKP